MSSSDETKEKLLALREEYTRRIDAIEVETHHKEEAVEKDFAEQATQSENNDVLATLDDEAQEMVMHIDVALDRINAGTYGQCVSCGESIQEERLQAIPFADKCITCAEKS